MEGGFNPHYSIDKDEYLTRQVKQNIRTLQTLIHDIQVIFSMIKDMAPLSSCSFALGNSIPFEYFFDKNVKRIELNKMTLVTNNEKFYK